MTTSKAEEVPVYSQHFVTKFDNPEVWIHSNKLLTSSTEIDRQNKKVFFPDGSRCIVDENGNPHISNTDPLTYIQLIDRSTGAIKFEGTIPRREDLPIEF